MAKKKTKVIATEITQTQKLVSNVSISIISNSRPIKTIKAHNMGTLNLLFGMIISLSGNPNSNYLPNYLSIGTGITNESIIGLTNLIEECNIPRNALIKNFKGPTKNESSASTVYQGFIPFSSGLTDASITEIGIFGTFNTDTLLARVELTNPVILKAGQNLLVEWTFDIRNIQDTDTITSTSGTNYQS